MFTYSKLQSAFCVLLKFQLPRYSFISSFPIGFSHLENEHHSSSFFLCVLRFYTTLILPQCFVLCMCVFLPPYLYFLL